tara:strand:+ start:159 stop:890 length:732 start_codon:yes stop_codon:yes gene_type:complete
MKENIKSKIYQLAASSDRGQRMNSLISPTYQEKLTKMESLVKRLILSSDEFSPDLIVGDWELIYSSVELFRSSPFFLAIEKAFQDQEKSDLFFKLHLLQVGSFGLSTIGSVKQSIDLEAKELISSFDTTIFGLTTIPFFGWFKLLPTFGGSVITIARNLKILDKKKLYMDLEKTKVSKLDGLAKIPFLSGLLMERWYPVSKVWKWLPWNKTAPSCEVDIEYVDHDLRIMRDLYGALYIYIRCT